MSDSLNSISSMHSIRERVLNWFSTPLGKLVIEQERQILDKILPDLFGYHFMQLGLVHDSGLQECTRINHHFIAHLNGEGRQVQGAAVRCQADALPIASDSIDVVVMSHVLEFSDTPHKILREIERILIGEGHLIIVGFNPWSLFGIWRLLLAWRDEPPWCGHFFSYNRIRDWFTLLDFELISLERTFYRPPFQNKKIMGKLHFMEKIGNYCWKIFGGIYVVVIRKRVIPLTPVKDLWSKRRSMIKSSIAEPSTRM